MGMRLIDADRMKNSIEIANPEQMTSSDIHKINELKKWIDYQPTVEAIPKDHITKAIDKVEEYICDVETDTVKAQGMAQALDIFEKALGEVEDGKID